MQLAGVVGCMVPRLALVTTSALIIDGSGGDEVGAVVAVVEASWGGEIVQPSRGGFCENVRL